MKLNDGYKNKHEIKMQRMEFRLDTSMYKQLLDIRKRHGVSVSELIRESIRRLIADAKEKAGVKLI